MLEALVIMQQGFPTRCLFTDLYEKYKDYMPVEIGMLIRTDELIRSCDSSPS